VEKRRRIATYTGLCDAEHIFQQPLRLEQTAKALGMKTNSNKNNVKRQALKPVGPGGLDVAKRAKLYEGAMIPSVEPVSVEPVAQWICPHGNHFCVTCEDCGRSDLRNNSLAWKN